MENKKIMNATPTMYKGIKYRSKLEARAAKELEENNIIFDYEPIRLTILPPFKYNNVTYRAVHYTPDFICGNYMLEIKGFPNDSWPLKKKFILKHIISNNLPYKFREIKNITELKTIIKEMKNEIS